VNITLGVVRLDRCKEKWLLWYKEQEKNTSADLGGAAMPEYLWSFFENMEVSLCKRKGKEPYYAATTLPEEKSSMLADITRVLIKRKTYTYR
jgi:hypothetical protein